MYGSDWFVSTQATTYRKWIETVAEVVTDMNATEKDKHNLFYNTASKVYRIEEKSFLKSKF